MKYNKKELAKRILLIMLGSAITSIGINTFIIPHKFLSGGVGGIALILQYLTNIQSGYYILAVNIPIFLIGMKQVDKDFCIFSLIGMLSLSLFMILTQNISHYYSIDDMIVSSIYGGILGGIGGAIVFQNRASMGGTDIIAVILKKKTGGTIATYLFAMNIVVVLIGTTINGLSIALYTLISMYITSQVMNRVMDGIERKKLLFVVTQKERMIADHIIKEVGRGVTFLHGQGAYTGNERNVIYCIVTLRQLPKIQKLIEDTDPQAFISILDTSEVHGKGFKKPAL
ncbi:YitT family protein [Crassaminicella profunda]|uniref:YitT family protein n=1 Tax=Crassaminicella profunda TaxID=1286698 RepID=UPI001CA68BD7|nr:YitT family protein [Crassaminicella profunda]QZY54499.1 YitT family protein [Crassaminicella profunda]